MPLCALNYLSKLVSHTISFIYELSLNFASFWDFLDFIHEIQTLVMNFLRSQRFHTICICISNHSHFILFKKSKTIMCKLWLHLKSWLKRTKKSQFVAPFEDIFILKPLVSHQMLFPVAKNASLTFKLFNKTGVTHNNIYLWVVLKICLFCGFFGLFYKTQTLVIKFLRSQRFHTICNCISNHSHFIPSKTSKTFMCKLWLHLKSWLKRTKKRQFSTTFEDNFILKP